MFARQVVTVHSFILLQWRLNSLSQHIRSTILGLAFFRSHTTQNSGFFFCKLHTSKPGKYLFITSNSFLHQDFALFICQKSFSKFLDLTLYCSVLTMINFISSDICCKNRENIWHIIDSLVIWIHQWISLLLYPLTINRLGINVRG